MFCVCEVYCTLLSFHNCFAGTVKSRFNAEFGGKEAVAVYRGLRYIGVLHNLGNGYGRGKSGAVNRGFTVQ